MNGWIIAFLIYIALGVGVSIAEYLLAFTQHKKWVAGAICRFTDMSVYIFLLYMGGAFN